jgi:uncharacterized membrane protein YhfC
MESKLPHLVVSFAMIVVGLVPIFYWARARNVHTSSFLWGTLAWIGTVSIKFAIAIPLNKPFLHFLVVSLPTWLASILFNSYIGFLTAITECGLLYFAVRFTSLRTYRFNQIIAFGIGFGAIEAILLGLRNALGILFVDASTAALVPVPYSSIAERASTLLVHTLACALIFYSVAAKLPYLFWISFTVKGLGDGLASWFVLSNATLDSSHQIGLYGAFIFLAVASSIALCWLSRRRGALEETESLLSAPESAPNAEAVETKSQ